MSDCENGSTERYGVMQDALTLGQACFEEQDGDTNLVH